MPSLRPAALFIAMLSCTRPEPEPPRPPRSIEAPLGVDPDVLSQAWLERDDPEAKCASNRDALARCLQARAHPDVPFFWVLYWDEHGNDEHGNGVIYSQTDLLAPRQRVIERLRADGAGQILDSSASQVWVVATHPVVRGAMAMPEVQHVEVACAEEDREFCACARLRVDQCPQHAFCHNVYGQPRDPTGTCMAPRQLAGCTRAAVCSDAGSHAIDPTGRPWLFPSSCKPAQPGWRHADHHPQRLPDCPAPRG